MSDEGFVTVTELYEAALHYAGGWAWEAWSAGGEPSAVVLEIDPYEVWAREHDERDFREWAFDSEIDRYVKVVGGEPVSAMLMKHEVHVFEPLPAAAVTNAEVVTYDFSDPVVRSTTRRRHAFMTRARERAHLRAQGLEESEVDRRTRTRSQRRAQAAQRGLSDLTRRGPRV